MSCSPLTLLHTTYAVDTSFRGRKQTNSITHDLNQINAFNKNTEAVRLMGIEM